MQVSDPTGVSQVLQKSDISYCNFSKYEYCWFCRSCICSQRNILQFFAKHEQNWQATYSQFKPITIWALGYRIVNLPFPFSPHVFFITMFNMYYTVWFTVVSPLQDVLCVELTLLWEPRLTARQQLFNGRK